MSDIPRLDRKGLRDFGLLMGTIIAVLFGLLLPFLFKHHFSLIPWLLAVSFWGLAIFTPNALEPIYQVWMKIGRAIGWVESRIILGIVFLIMVIPMGLIMRLIQRDTMARKFIFQTSSYRIASQQKSKVSMEKPY
jgi:tetrahydromethanopterin S-methyltransferase subunit G